MRLGGCRAIALALGVASGCSAPSASSPNGGQQSWRDQVLVLPEGTTAWVPATPSSESPRARAENSVVNAGGAVITIGLAPGAWAMGDGEVSQWVATCATIVSRYLGTWPVTRAFVFVSPGDAGAIDGETVDDRGGAIRLRIGRDVSLRAANENWVLVHEMIHLVLPDVGWPHPWLEEGVATYVEPIMRARAGAISEASVWAEWLESMSQGLPDAHDEGLDRTHTWARTYWGGALYFLKVDIEIRRATHNERSLRDALRAIAREGRGIGEHWGVERFIAVGDTATGVPAMRAMYERLALAPGTVDLAATWRDLGVAQKGPSVAFDDEAPLAYVRRGIMDVNGGGNR